MRLQPKTGRLRRGRYTSPDQINDNSEKYKAAHIICFDKYRSLVLLQNLITTLHATETVNTHWTLLGTLTGSGTHCTYRWPPLSGSCIDTSLSPAT